MKKAHKFIQFLVICLLPSVSQALIFRGAELLGRPTQNSISLKVLVDTGIDAYVQYGTAPGVYTSQTPVVSAAANEPWQIVIDNLQPNTKYYYRLRYRQTGFSTWISRTPHTFYTQRSVGSVFSFSVVSDSHMNSIGNSSVYNRTMLNIAASTPDFHVDLGDTFWMNGITSQSAANTRYISQYPFMNKVSHSAPIFLVMGNHENEEGWNLDDTPNPANSLPIMTTNARKRYFLNPTPTVDGFYTGNNDTHPSIIGDQIHDDYYAFQWGDALFVAIDPYFYTMQKPFSGAIAGELDDEGPGAGRWAWTLGETQFNWLKQTLINSNATFKFIFAHQIVGGRDDYGRGGADAAHMYEWGGENDQGVWEFNPKRDPALFGTVPLRDVLTAARVTAFFHGHDHQFAKEERDGIVYQLVPMPSDRNYGLGFNTYHESDPYTDVVRPNSGHLLVNVSPDAVTVKYIRAFLSGHGPNGAEEYSYTINKPVEPESMALMSASNASSGSIIQGGKNGAVNPRLGEKVHILLNSANSGELVKVMVYTLSGQLVWETSKQVSGGQDSIDWDGTNSAGELVASDVYVIKVSGAGLDQTRKAVILR